MSEGHKGQSAQFVQGLGMTNACKNLCTAKHNSLSLLKALTLKITGYNSAVSAKSTTR